jgi:hypothetical protein
MNVKLGEIIDSIPVLRRIYEGAHPPGKLAYQLAMIQKAIDPHAEAFGIARKAILDRTGTYNEEKNIFEFLDRDGNFNQEKADEYREEISKLAETEIEMMCTLSVGDLDKLGMNVSLTPAEINQIMWLLAE